MGQTLPVLCEECEEGGIPLKKMSPHTDITVLLDRSGSMQSIRDAMESGFEEFLNAHRENPTTRLSLVQFDSQNHYDVVYTALPVDEAPKLRLQPRGMTPLRDALCTTIDKTGERLSRMKYSLRPSKVLFIVITDGLENASYKFTVEDVRQRVKRQSSTYSWEFVFLGANQDAVIEAEKLAFDIKKAITYNPNLNATKGAMRGLTSNTMNYVNQSDLNIASASLDWDDKQRKESTTS